MERQRVWLVFLALLTLGTSLGTRAEQRGDQSAPQRQPASPRGGELKLTGEVLEIHAPRGFTVRERTGAQRELLVYAPRALSPGFVGATTTIEGTLRRLTEAELTTAVARGDIDARTRERLAGRTVLVATSVLAITQGEPAAAVEPAPPMPRAQAPDVPRPAVEEKPMTMRAAMLVSNVEILAGRPVRLLQGRVVGVLEPRAFLIEPATPYLKAMGQRDRLLVLVGSASLRVPADLIVGSTVTVTGVARTLVGVQVTREVPWPARLGPELVERLEVRGAILATSVETPDGVELTDVRSVASR